MNQQAIYLGKVSEAFSSAPWAADIIAVAGAVGFAVYLVWGLFYYRTQNRRSPFEPL